MTPSPSAEQRPHPPEREAEGGVARGAEAVGEGEDGGQQRAVVARWRGEGQPGPGGGRRALGGAAHHATEEPGMHLFNLFSKFGRKLQGVSCPRECVWVKLDVGCWDVSREFVIRHRYFMSRSSHLLTLNFVYFTSIFKTQYKLAK